MKYLLVLIFSISTSNILAQRKFYSEIDSITYNSYRIIDTLMRKGSYLVTKRKERSRFNSYKECIQIDYGSRKRYFELAYDWYFINDTTICSYGNPFKSTSIDGGFMKNGLWVWVYTSFYKRKTGSLSEESGVRFAVDSMPINLCVARYIDLPSCNSIRSSTDCPISPINY